MIGKALRHPYNGDRRVAIRADGDRTEVRVNAREKTGRFGSGWEHGTGRVYVKHVRVVELLTQFSRQNYWGSSLRVNTPGHAQGVGVNVDRVRRTEKAGWLDRLDAISDRGTERR
jgi:hypothetical protein